MSARTPQLVRLEVTLAKARYYDSCTFEEAEERDARLTALENELAAMDGGGCEHVDRRDPDDRWPADDADGYDVAPAWDGFDR